MNKSIFTKLLLAFCCAACAASCGASSADNRAASAERLKTLPPVILWAWERPENLEFADADRYGVAYLAQTLELRGEDVVFRPRRQPLRVADKAFLIAVTRVEAEKINSSSASLSPAMRGEIVERVLKTLEQKGVRAVQIDFDAAVSERNFYRALLNDLRARLPADVSLSITALASFCVGDRWFKDLPVDEAVPMIFRMGADSNKIRSQLANGEDFREPLCQKSYGVATDEPLPINFHLARRKYIFNHQKWESADLDRIAEIFRAPTK